MELKVEINIYTNFHMENLMVKSKLNIFQNLRPIVTA